MALTEIIADAATAAGLIATIVQIWPCAAKPWTALARHLGRALNREVIEKIDRNEALTARYRIVSFDDELLHTDRKHSEERFGQILDDIDTYERYCRLHPDFENNKAVHAIRNIERVYDRCKQEGSFV